MPSNRPTVASDPVYTIWVSGTTHRGTAHELLGIIRKNGEKNSAKLRKLSTEQYADLLIRDADFFLPEQLLKFLQRQPYASEFDRALRYLSEMPASGVRILAGSQPGERVQ